ATHAPRRAGAVIRRRGCHRGASRAPASGEGSSRDSARGAMSPAAARCRSAPSRRPREDQMTASIRPMDGAFARLVSGIDISKPLDREDVLAIEAGMDRHAVLVFRDQPITDEQQIAFTLQFGALESYESPGHIRARSEHRLGPGIADFSNL